MQATQIGDYPMPRNFRVLLTIRVPRQQPTQLPSTLCSIVLKSLMKLVKRTTPSIGAALPFPPSHQPRGKVLFMLASERLLATCMASGLTSMEQVRNAATRKQEPVKAAPGAEGHQ